MGLVRCPQCGRVADGIACFACGYEWGSEPATAPRPRSEVTSAPVSVPSAAPVAEAAPPARSARPADLSEVLGTVPAALEGDDDFDPFAGPGAIQSWAEEEPVDEPASLDDELVVTRPELEFKAPIDSDLLARLAGGADSIVDASTQEIAAIADGFDYGEFADVEATEVLRPMELRGGGRPGGGGPEHTVRNARIPGPADPIPTADDGPVPSDLHRGFSVDSVEPTERIGSGEPTEAYAVRSSMIESLGSFAEEPTTRRAPAPMPDAAELAARFPELGLDFEDEITEQGGPPRPPPLEDVSDPQQVSIEADLQAFLDDEDTIQGGAASHRVPSMPAPPEDDFGGLLDDDAPPAPPEDDFGGLLDDETPLPSAGGFGGFIATGGAPLADGGEFTGLADTSRPASRGVEDVVAPPPTDSFRDLFSDDEIAEIGLRPLADQPGLSAPRPRGPVKGSVRGRRNPLEFEDPLAPESDFAPPTIIAPLPGVLPGASPEADKAHVTQADGVVVDSDFEEPTGRIVHLDDEALSEELLLEQSEELLLEQVVEPMDGSRTAVAPFGPPLSDNDIHDPLSTEGAGLGAPTKRPAAVAGLRATTDDDLLNDVDALLAVDDLLGEELLPAPGDAPPMPTAQASRLAARLAELADSLEAEGRLSEASLLYEVQAFLSSL